LESSGIKGGRGVARENVHLEHGVQVHDIECPAGADRLIDGEIIYIVIRFERRHQCRHLGWGEIRHQISVLGRPGAAPGHRRQTAADLISNAQVIKRRQDGVQNGD